MKNIILSLTILLSAFNAYGQTSLREGDACFDAGDYACAVIKYNAAFERLSGKDKQKVEIKLLRARRCAEHIALANQAFSNGNYKTAKEKYSIVLESNPNDKIAQARIEECESFLNPPPPPSLNVSPSQLSFSATGGNRQINVTTNATYYSVSSPPSWCYVSKNSSGIEVKCYANNSFQARKCELSVSINGKQQAISVSQAGKGYSLFVETEPLSFTWTGGRKSVAVETNAQDFTVIERPNWCKYQKTEYGLLIVCEENYLGQNRRGQFKISAGDKTEYITVSQTAMPATTQSATTSQQRDYYTSSTPSTTYSQSSSSYSRTIQYSEPSCFNCPNAKYPIGLSFGYVEKELYDTEYFSASLKGVQVGLRIEPLMKYGFGINTGIFYEYYSTATDNLFNGYIEAIDFENDYYEHIINVPLHLEYRLNFSKYFNVFVYGGASVDMWFVNGFEYQPSIDYGGGLRINHLQFNLGRSLFVNKMSDITDLSDLNRYKDLICTLSIMF